MFRALYFFIIILWVFQARLFADNSGRIASLEEQVSAATPADKPALYIKLANSYLNSDVKKALSNAELARSFARKTKSTNMQAKAAHILGDIYSRQNDPAGAVRYYEEELEIREKQPADKQLSLLYYHVATLYRSVDKARKACEFYEKSLEVAKKTGEKELIPNLYEALFRMYYDRRQYQEALGYFKFYIDNKDSVLKRARKQEISQYKNKAQEKDKLIGELNTITDQQKQEIVNKELEIRNKNNERKFLIAILSFTTLFILLLSVLYLSIRRANKKLSVQYLQIQDQKEKITKQRDEIEEKRSIIETINIEMTQSLQYALTIQQVLLPPLEEINNAFPQSFVLYRPKDIVSGDFYWISPRVNNRVFIAAADCTGHGVPGGFMSMIGIDKLNEIFNRTDLVPYLHPATILALLDQDIKIILRQNLPNTTSLHDGLDIALCEFNFNTGEVLFSGANRPLWLWKAASNQLIEYPRVKRCIGGIYKSDFEYTDQKLDIAHNDMIYIFSDGFADQYGGPQLRKLMKKNFKHLLASVHQQSPARQLEYLNRYFDEWKGEEPQVDDVMMIGIRYSFNL